MGVLSFLLCPLPVGDGTGYDVEAAMLAGQKLALDSPPGRIANLELAQEMPPLVFDLTGRDRQPILANILVRPSL